MWLPGIPSMSRAVRLLAASAPVRSSGPFLSSFFAKDLDFCIRNFDEFWDSCGWMILKITISTYKTLVLLQVVDGEPRKGRFPRVGWGHASCTASSGHSSAEASRVSRWESTVVKSWAQNISRQPSGSQGFCCFLNWKIICKRVMFKNYYNIHICLPDAM